MTKLWRERNVTRELFHKVVRGLRMNGITAERLYQEIDDVYSELLDKEDEEEIRAAVIPKVWR